MKSLALMVMLALPGVGQLPVLAQQPLVQVSRSPGASPRIGIAYEFFELLSRNNWDEALEKLDPRGRAAEPQAQLQALWRSLIADLGPLKNVQVLGTERVEGMETVLVQLQFSQARRQLQLFFNPENQIQAVTFVPEYAAPEYVQLDALEEIPVMIAQGPDRALPGTLTLPKGNGPFPAVVLVHGSGPGDRDQTVGPNKPFRDLAWGLSSQGVAVLRYDKRTRVYPQQFVGKPFTVQEETIDDALAAVRLLRQTEKVDPQRIFVIGYSLGGMLIPRIAQQDPNLAGLVVLAGNTRPFEDLFLEQASYLIQLDGVVLPEEKLALTSVINQVALIKSPDLAQSPATQSLLGAPPSYWLDLRGYQPAIVAQTLKRPLLILQGERDYQVTLTDFQGWKTALAQRSSVTLKTYPQLNHLFMVGEGKGRPEEYNQPNHVDRQVIDDLARWLQAK